MTKPIVNKMHDKYVDKFLSTIDVEIKVNNRDKIFARIYEQFCPSDRSYYYVMIHDDMEIKYVDTKRYYIRRRSKTKVDYMLTYSRSRLDMTELATRYGQSEIPSRRVKNAKNGLCGSA